MNKHRAIGISKIWMKTSSRAANRLNLFIASESEVFVVDYSKIVVAPEDDVLLPTQLMPFLPYTNHLNKLSKNKLDLIELRFTVDGDTFLKFIDGSILGFTNTFDAMTESGTFQDVRFYSPESVFEVQSVFDRAQIGNLEV